MEKEAVVLSKQLMDNIRIIVEDTKLFADEQDFVTQAVIKQISKFK